MPEKKSRHEAPTGRLLNSRQRAFANLYGTGRMTAKDAAIAAGYGPATARAHCYDLLRNPLVKAELDKIAERVREKTVYDAAAAFGEAGVALEFARETKNANALVRCVELRARLHGLLVEKQEVTVAGPNIAGALAEARARVLSAPTPLLPVRDQADTVDAEYRTLPSSQVLGAGD